MSEINSRVSYDVDLLFDGDEYLCNPLSTYRSDWLIDKHRQVGYDPIEFDSVEEYQTLPKDKKKRYEKHVDSVNPRYIKEITEKLDDILFEMMLEQRE